MYEYHVHSYEHVIDCAAVVVVVVSSLLFWFVLTIVNLLGLYWKNYIPSSHLGLPKNMQVFLARDLFLVVDVASFDLVSFFRCHWVL